MIITFFESTLLFVLLTYLVYFSFVIFILNKTILWEFSLLKDSIIWFIFSSSLILYRSTKIDKNYDFIVLLLENFKLVVFYEFLVNFYTFQLWQEIILIPFITFLALIEYVSKMESNRDKNKEVASCISGLLSIIGFTLLGYVIYKTVVAFDEISTYQSFISFLLPITLVVTNLPFYYLLALYIAYENVFIRLKFFYPDSDVKKIKWYMFRQCLFNLQKARKLNEIMLFEKDIDDLKENIRSL